MSRGEPFGGFPGVARATAIPNLFFATVLPDMTAPGELLAFLWVARLVQEQKGTVRFVSATRCGPKTARRNRSRGWRVAGPVSTAVSRAVSNLGRFSASG